MVNNGYRFRLAFHCQSLHPGNQFTEAERLPQVIVRPKPAFEIIKVGKMWVKRKMRKNATITLYFNML